MLLYLPNELLTHLVVKVELEINSHLALLFLLGFLCFWPTASR